MRLAGHPLHPMLVHFPVAFWTVATAAHVAATAGLAEVGWLAGLAGGAGLATAALAMIAGAAELPRIDRDSAAMRIATWHMMTMATVWLLYLVAFLLQGMAVSPESGPPPSASAANLIATASAVAGFVLMAGGGWLGGQLVYGHGVGVGDRRRG